MKFGKQLQATLVQDWGNHYVDYKSMKQLIKDSTSDEPAVRLQNFVALLASQLEQVNKFFVSKETELCAQWRATNMGLVAELSEQPAAAGWLRSCLLRLEVGAIANLTGDTTAYPGAELELEPELEPELKPEPEPEPEPEPGLEPEPEPELQLGPSSPRSTSSLGASPELLAGQDQLARFRAVHDDAQRLHQFVAINFIGFVKSMKKFEKKTELSVAHLFMPRLQRSKFFNSPKLASLLNDLDYNAKLLLYRLGFVETPAALDNGEGDEHTQTYTWTSAEQELRRCDLCTELSPQPVALSCTHRFCFPCAASASAVASSDGEWACPMCMRPQLLNPEVYTATSFGQIMQRSHSSGSLANSLEDQQAGQSEPDPRAAELEAEEASEGAMAMAQKEKEDDSQGLPGPPAAAPLQTTKEEQEQEQE
jgi:hypothetical protein